MATAELNARLRKCRRALVLAAERVIRESPAGQSLPRKTQFSNLVAVCGEASCAEEIENFLRYQAGRAKEGREGWERPFADKVIKSLRAETNELSGDDAAMVEAWRLYAVYLMRAFTYQRADAGGDRRRGGGNA